MIPTIPQSATVRTLRLTYVATFFLFLFIPLIVVVAFAFNDAAYPMPPWHGFTLDWFLVAPNARVSFLIRRYKQACGIALRWRPLSVASAYY